MRTLLYVAMTFAVALALGIGSAWYMIDRGSPLTTVTVGPWVGWTSEGNPNADVYTKAHIARAGRLPVSSTIARYFVARTDDEGRDLTSSCEYTVSGSALNARWWSLALFNENGSVIDNPSARYAFNSDGSIRHADGTYRITLARTARPENWLPSGDAPAHKLVLSLSIYGTRDTDPNSIGEGLAGRLPKIEREACR